MHVSLTFLFPRKCRGYGISDTSKYTDFTVKEFELKTAGPRDVTIAIDYCGGECRGLYRTEAVIADAVVLL